MELRHIRYFITVAEEGSFTKAAEALCIAQPPLSRQIRDLELELGTSLFIRKARGLTLTEEGERFLQYAHRIAQLADQSYEDIRQMSSGLSGTLYLATVEGYAPSLFAGWIGEFRKDYPLVEYELWNGNSDDVVKRIQSGLSDIAVITAPYDEEGLDGRIIYKEPWVAMIPAEHPLSKGSDDTVELADLAPYDLIIPSRQSRRQEIENWFMPLHVEPKIICKIAHMLNAYELTASGVGIAIYPASAAKYVSDRVKIKRIVNPDVMATYVLVRSAERSLPKVAGTFWEAVEKNEKYS